MTSSSIGLAQPGPDEPDRLLPLRPGPAGLNKATGVDWVGTKTWRVRFLRGKTYRFVCDPHADEMRGAFRVR